MINFFSEGRARRLIKTLKDKDLLMVGYFKPNKNKIPEKPEIRAISFEDLKTEILVSIPSSAVNYSNVLFVDPVFGNDATALVGRFDKPYQSISQATTTAGALGGSISQRVLVYIRKGTYSTSVNLTNWVDFYCEPGVVFTGGALVQDLGVSVVSNFFGYAKFVSKSTYSLFIQGSSTVTFEFDTIENTSGQSLRFFPLSGGQCNVTVIGNSILNTTNSITVAPRGRSNVTMHIKNFIRAPHSIFDIRDGYDGQLLVNCPKIFLSAPNFIGGNFKQAVVSYSSTANARMIFNADFINEMPTFLGGIAGMITNWSATSGIIEVNGNIYGGETYGVFASGNQAAGRIVVNGNVFSNIQPVYVASENSCYIKNGLISKQGTNVANAIRTIQNAKLYLSNVHVDNTAIDTTMIQLDSATSKLYMYNVTGQGFAGSLIAKSVDTNAVAPITIQSHGSRFTLPLGVNVVDELSPSGFIYDPLLVIPKF